MSVTYQEYPIYLFIYLFGAKKADRFTVVIESMQSLFGKKNVVNVHFTLRL